MSDERASQQSLPNPSFKQVRMRLAVFDICPPADPINQRIDPELVEIDLDFVRLAVVVDPTFKPPAFEWEPALLALSKSAAAPALQFLRPKACALSG